MVDGGDKRTRHGADGLAFEPIADLQADRAHELEGELILSSVVGPWIMHLRLLAGDGGRAEAQVRHDPAQPRGHDSVAGHRD